MAEVRLWLGLLMPLMELSVAETPREIFKRGRISQRPLLEVTPVHKGHTFSVMWPKDSCSREGHTELGLGALVAFAEH